MSLYVAPKLILNTFLEKVRAYTSEPLSDCVFRKGPQVGIKLGRAPSACIVALRRLADGEQSTGSGNHWWHSWQLAIWIGVPDDETHPEAAEDLRLDLIDDFTSFMGDIDTRTMFEGAKVGRITTCELGMGQYFPADDTVWRYVEMTVEYRTLRSGSNG